MSQLHGRFCWHDLMSPDTTRAIAFYKAVVGWGAQEFASDASYTMWTAGGSPNGGIMTLTEEAKAMGAPPHWLAYVGVRDLTAFIAKATALGGKILVPPTEVPDAGAFSVIQDPQGAVFGAFQPAGDMPDHGSGVGQMTWHELNATDHTAAMGFYTELFGWQKSETMDMGDGNTYQMFAHGGRTVGGMFDRNEQMPPPHWLSYITVSDLDKALKSVTTNGGQILNGPMKVPGGDRVAQCLDPQGAAFALHEAAPS